MRVNTAELAALLASFVLGVVFSLVSAWPRRKPLASAADPTEPQISWPSMLDAQTRLAIAVELAARTDDARIAILRCARDEERDPRIRSVVDKALGPVIGEPR